MKYKYIETLYEIYITHIIQKVLINTIYIQLFQLFFFFCILIHVILLCSYRLSGHYKISTYAKYEQTQVLFNILSEHSAFLSTIDKCIYSSFVFYFFVTLVPFAVRGW